MLVAPRSAARFAGASEYDRSYKWNDSRKSASYFPAGEQLRPSAGIESLRRYNVMEPPLQRKKRVEHIRESVQLGVPETPTEDSFLVAGQKSEKFAPSQPHPNYAKEAHKRRSQSLAAQREQERLDKEQRQHQRDLQIRQRGQREESGDYLDGADYDDEPQVATPETPREVKRQLTMPDRQRKQKEKERQEQQRQEQQRQEQQRQQAKRRHRRRRHRSEEAAGPAADASVSTKQLEAQLAKARREARRLEAEALMERGGEAAEQRPAAAAAADAKPKAEPYQRPKTPPFYRDLADPYAVRDADYAKKRQLGLADAKRPQGNKPTKASEYQTSYAAAAAAAAEASEHQRRRERQRAALAENRDAARRSHLDVVNSAAAAGAKKVATAGGGPGSKPAPAAGLSTEYRRQFQYKRPDVRSAAVGLVPPRKLTKSQDYQPPKVKVDGREFKPSETLNPQRMSFPLGSYGPIESEYHRAFGEAAAANGGETDWQRRLREARELRQRAAQYRLRAYGTHFSRQHLAQVYAPNGSLDAWQPVPSARSNDDAVDERPRTAPAQHPQAAWDSDPEELTGAAVESPDDDFDADEVADYDENSRPRRSQQKRRQPRRRARSATGAGAAADADAAVIRRRLPESQTAGRFGTPRIRDRARQGFVRHHYDRTTPSFGGVLVGQPDAEIGGEDVDDREAPPPPAAVDSDEAEAVDETEDLGRPLGGRKPVGRIIRESRQLLQNRQGSGSRKQPQSRTPPEERPPAGLPTRDVAPLIDETASHDTPLTLSPRAERRQDQQRAGAAIQRRRDEPRVSGSERSATPAPAAPQQPALDDAQFSDGFFSDTASLVSSSTISLGSQTLERARQRQEDFWGRK